jgi:hypothetical protein
MNKKTYQNYKSDYIYLTGGSSIDNIDENKFEELYTMTPEKYKEYKTKRDYKPLPRNKYTNIFHIYSILVANALVSEIQKKNEEFLDFLYQKAENEIEREREIEREIENDEGKSKRIEIEREREIKRNIEIALIKRSAKKTLIRFYGGYIPMLEP